jgi:transcriptional regulator with XRE-family HTH domain
MNSRLIYLRKKVFKLTQQELADQLGLNRASLSQYERGHTPIPRYTIKLICLMFEINESGFYPAKVPFTLTEKIVCRRLRLNQLPRKCASISKK